MEKTDKLLKNEKEYISIDYIAPQILIEEVIVEKGFAYSDDDNAGDGGDV
jgi:hypothetical protein